MSRGLLARKPVARLRHNISSSNITTEAWVQLVAAMDQAVSAIEIYNGSASILELATGGSGSEVALPYYIIPGGSSILLPIEIARGVRLAAKAVDSNATVNSLVLNFFG